MGGENKIPVNHSEEESGELFPEKDQDVSFPKAVKGVKIRIPGPYGAVRP
jgi:hypothetical protein